MGKVGCDIWEKWVRWAETTLSEALSPAGPVYLQRHSRAIVSKATPVLPISGILLFCESVRSVGAGQRRVSWVMRCARVCVCVCGSGLCVCSVRRSHAPAKQDHTAEQQTPPRATAFARGDWGDGHLQKASGMLCGSADPEGFQK